MAEQTIPVDGTSAPIEVPPLKLFGVDTDAAITIYSKGGSVIWNTREAMTCRICFAPNNQITIKATNGTANVILTTED